MLGVLLFLAQAAAATAPPAATPVAASGAARPAPLLARSTDPARPANPVSAEPRTLADLAKERRASGVKPHGGTLSVAGGTVASESGSTAEGAHAVAGSGNRETDSARAAQKRMDRAVKDGIRADRRRSESTRAAARAEWDAAAEACRQTPGCTPGYRDDTRIEGHKPVQTNDEIIKEVAKKHSLSE